MLNLQTIAESLNTKCQGRAWVFVTSQEDMDKVVGDRTKQQGNDFSKIQARFKTRVKLTSADVEEVIRKRLLEKNEAGAAALQAIYAKESANFKTLFDFVDGAKTYRNYTDEAHFVGTYPFVSYQFPLFQAAIEGISDHNVFEGRNSSVGERSMLGVVQQVAKDIGDVEVGTLATFDHMFAGIRASLKSAAQRSIDVAERNLDNQLAIRLLKALFLVKYVESFQATPRNLTVLVYDRFGLDLPALVRGGQGGADPAGDADLRPAQRQRLRVPDQRRAGHRGGDQERRHRRLRGQRTTVQDPFRRRHQDQQAPLRQERPGLPVRLQARRPGPRPAARTLGPLHHPGVPVHARTRSGCTAQARTSCASSSNPTSACCRTCACCIKTEKYTKRKQTTSLSAIEEQILRSKAAQNVEREKELVERIRALWARPPWSSTPPTCPRARRTRSPV